MSHYKNTILKTGISHIIDISILQKRDDAYMGRKSKNWTNDFIKEMIKWKNEDEANFCEIAKLLSKKKLQYCITVADIEGQNEFSKWLKEVLAEKSKKK